MDRSPLSSVIAKDEFEEIEVAEFDVNVLWELLHGEPKGRKRQAVTMMAQLQSKLQRPQYHAMKLEVGMGSHAWRWMRFLK
ncbi:hypothetical protein SASPL_129946 [Salvia splendens]|uniref:Uncharacterized protein n=1 Tax=Salvia splendens TaxID=180675 RepID=A0A8X8X7Y3_SALSN|nr:hypothetical protein SASPL_129946 [Salvia splendens]